MTDTSMQNVQDLPAKTYEPTEREIAAAEKFTAREKDGTKGIKIEIDGTNVATSAKHVDQAVGWLMIGDAIGTSSLLETLRVVNDAVNLSGQTGSIADETQANQILSVIKGIGPKDPVEIMLATQMVAIHRATIVVTRNFNFSDTIQQRDVNERTLNKLARTFASQVDTLKRYRSKGEQTVEVKHVHVHDGGQAIVGNVQQGGGKPKNSDGTP